MKFLLARADWLLFSILGIETTFSKKFLTKLAFAEINGWRQLTFGSPHKLAVRVALALLGRELAAED